MESSVWISSVVKDGDYAIVVRQPCFWTGIIHLVRVRITTTEMDDDGR